MSTYVVDHMRNSLANHVLEPQLDGSLRMGTPGDYIYAVYFVEFANRICIAGDICLGGNENGIVSNVGYKLPWFAGQLSECYLCEKFLHREWQWAAAVEEIEWQIQEAKEEADVSLADSWWLERADKLKQFIASPGWKYDEPNIGEFYEFMTDLGDDCCEIPGYDYPRGQAGWLCAIQQKFVELSKWLNDL